MQKIHDRLGCLMALVFLSAMYSCHNYYKATSANMSGLKDKAGSLGMLKNQHRDFILRSGDKAWYMREMSLSNDQRILTADLDTLPLSHRLHLKNGVRGKMRYDGRKEGHKEVLTEVHLYIPADTILKPGPMSLSLDKIQKIEVLEKDKGRTTGSYIVGALGYTIGAMVIAGIIIAATKSSCPFVSAYTSDEFLLQGEIYGGAIYPQLARDDYMPLRMRPAADGRLKIKISNELQEKQFTDMADLLVISHAANAKVLSDEKGNLYSILHPESPLKAWTSNCANALPLVIAANDERLLHFDDSLGANAENYLIAEFKKPRNAKKAKLLLSIKNTYWLDYLYGEMAKGFGSYYARYIRKQYKTPVSTLQQWAIDQKLPLQVSIRSANGWQQTAALTTIGPLATREVVVPLDLTGSGDDVVVRLSSGFMFWEVDHVAIDYTDDRDFKVDTLLPSVATDEAGRDVLPQLAKKDGAYLAQPLPGNSVTLEYQPVYDGATHSYILHTKGYYEHVRDFKGAPKIAFLKKFYQPNAFPEFSVEMYKKFHDRGMAFLSKN